MDKLNEVLHSLSGITKPVSLLKISHVQLNSSKIIPFLPILIPQLVKALPSGKSFGIIII